MQSNYFMSRVNVRISAKLISKLLVCALLWVASYTESLAQGATCDDPIVIGCGESAIGSTIGIDNDNATSGAGSCQFISVGLGGQQWFVLTPASTGPVTISTVDATTNYDSKLHVYTGICGNLQCVAANDDFDINASIYSSQITNVNLNEGTLYYIRVGGYQSDEGLFSLSISECSGVVSGCTDVNACNFNPSANTDDGSCVMPGCNVPDACNYDINAGCDDGSCCFTTCNSITVTSGFYPEEIGWTIFTPQGLEIASGGAPVNNINVCINDPSCEYVMTLTDAWGDGWNGANYTITSPSGTIEATGTLLSDNITNPNFQTSDVLLSLGGAIEGCTDIASSNYNPDATCDNGSCVYCEAGSSVLKVILTDSYGDGWNGAQLTINNSVNNALISATLLNGFADSVLTCAASGCYSVEVTDGSYPEEVAWSIVDVANNIILEGLAGQLIYFGWDGAQGCVTEGCIDATACNYDSQANLDNGSCVYPGCTFSEACNYDSLAGCDDGSCCFNSCINISVTAGTYPGEISWQLLDNASNIIAEGGAPTSVNVCLISPICAGIFATYDTYGDGWNGANFSISNNGNIQTSGTLANGFFGENVVNIGDLIPGCTDPAAVNFQSLADCENESCIYSGCTDSLACNFNTVASINDNSCDYPGCLDELACNYDAGAGCADNSCEYPLQTYLTCNGDCINDADNDGICDEIEIVGCQDITACNYQSNATNAGECIFALEFLDCAGNCLNDTDNDGICDELEIFGCTDLNACNFDLTATENNGSCTYPEANLDCQGNCINDINNNGICDETEIGGCTDPAACNYDAGANMNDNSCTYPGCTDVNACNYSASTGCSDNSCEYPGCIVASACNYDATASCDDGNCVFPGCLDISACNYDASAGCSADICIYPGDITDCSGNCYNDADGDGVCDELEIIGCTDISACNYDPMATDNSSCDYPLEYYNCDGTCLVDSDNDGICDAFESNGCTDNLACNFNPFALVDDGTCVYPGCSDSTACNFDPTAGCSNGACDFGSCTIPFACNFNPAAICANDALCEGIPGSACDDGNPATTGELYDDNCNCVAPVSNTIYDIVAASTDHNTLETALIASGLDQVLSEPGTYTLFAPTDAAFAALPAGTLEALLADPTGALTAVLQYHTLGSVAFSFFLEDGMIVQTLQGQDVVVSINANGIFINDAQVIIADITADNGVVHVIDAVLIPQVPVSNTIYDIVAASAVHNTLQTALDVSGLNEVLDAPGDYTLFAPTDAAFAALPSGTLAALLADPNGALTNILLYHVLGGTMLSADLSDGMVLTTLQGQDVVVSINANGVFINDAQVIIADITADNGVVHVIDAVLIPQAPNAGCTNANACNYDFTALQDDGSCVFGGCTLVEACNYDMNAACDNNDVCVFPGCTDPAACNYDALAACSADICTYPDGCTDVNACNFDASATCDNGTCEYSPDEFYDCNGNCYFDTDGDGICDAFETSGCTDPSACNYSPFVFNDDGSCLFPGCTDSSACNFDPFTICDDGSCTFPGCNVFPACNFNPNAGCDDGSCQFGGCIDATACNFDEGAQCDDGTCYYSTAYFDCDSVCYNDNNGNGICDEFEVPGCTDPTACNYDPIAIYDNGLCTYPGCADSLACNYVGFVGCPDESCVYPGCTDPIACNFDPTTFCDDGSCTFPGCLDNTACNYDAFAQCDGFNCEYANLLYDCNGFCVNDADGDLVCDELEVFGCTAPEACNYNPIATEDNNTCSFPALYYNCDGTCVNDQDADGICDIFETAGCTDSLACNYNSFVEVNDFSCLYPGCNDAAACNFNPEAGCLDFSCYYPETFYDCNGNCINDADGNGICDELELTGCTDITACNYDILAFIDDGSCSYPGCMDPTACNYDNTAICDDGLCSFPGCTSPEACNYDPLAICDDGNCIFPGCDDITACNYDSEAACSNNELCVFAAEFYDCFGQCINDSDGDFVCDELEIAGCIDPTACNYDPSATDIAECTYPETYYNCDGTCEIDSDNDGICNQFDDLGCTDSLACNYNEFAITSDGNCTYPGCIDSAACNFNEIAACDDGTCILPGCLDSMACNFIPNYSCDGGQCIYPGCGDTLACNYDGNALCTSSDYCQFPLDFYDCIGQCLSDSDADGVCDQLEILGCTDENACNFNPSATESIDVCTYPEQYYDCFGVCIDDADLDGICDVFDLIGCIDPAACNYNPLAVEGDNSCTYPGCTDSSACNFDVTAACNDGSCIASGCLDSSACNYNASAGCENGSCIFNSCGDPFACNYDDNYLCGDLSLCTYAAQYLNCEGFCLNDQDNDGICDELDIVGCTDSLACNYNAFAIESDSNCTYAFPYYNCDGLCINDEDGDGVCTELEIAGCTDFAACNFDPTATEDDSTCTFPELYYDCFGNCLADADNDSICDALDNTGCTDSSACDYNPFATISNGICTYPELYYNCQGNCIDDTDNDGICDPLEIAGCIIPSACNYNALATDYDSSCVFPGCTNELACNYDPTAGCDNNSCYLPLPGFLCDGSCDGDADNDGLCDYFETNGCTDSTACNFNPYATVDDFTCSFPGCTDPNACNYDANAGCDVPGLCDLPVTYYNCDGSCESDVDADGICDPFEITGCTDPAACNYNPFVPANADDGSCTEVVFAAENISVTSDSFPSGYEWNGALLTTSGEYVWVGTTAAGCDSIVTLTFEYVIVIATNDVFSNDEIEIWPNPAKNFIQLRTTFATLPDLIVVTDINGKVVMTESKTARLDVSALESGLYIMRITANGNSINKRFEILR